MLLSGNGIVVLAALVTLSACNKGPEQVTGTATPPAAPVVAAAFHPSLAPVGVLLAVLGYALGTYAAWFCGVLMQMVAPVTGN